MRMVFLNTSRALDVFLNSLGKLSHLICTRAPLHWTTTVEIYKSGFRFTKVEFWKSTRKPRRRAGPKAYLLFTMNCFSSPMHPAMAQCTDKFTQSLGWSVSVFPKGHLPKAALRAKAQIPLLEESALRLYRIHQYSPFPRFPLSQRAELKMYQMSPRSKK